MPTHFASQYTNITNPDWKTRSCSIVSLWMVLKSLQKDFHLSVDELLEEALKINGYSEQGLWKHSSLAILAHNYGLAAYTEEFKSEPHGEKTKYAEKILKYGVEKIYKFLESERGCVIVSIPKSFDAVDKPHSILLHGIKEDNGEKYFIYNDSEKETTEAGQDLLVKVSEFEEKWRKLAIFISIPEI